MDNITPEPTDEQYDNADVSDTPANEVEPFDEPETEDAAGHADVPSADDAPDNPPYLWDDEPSDGLAIFDELTTSDVAVITAEDEPAAAGVNMPRVIIVGAVLLALIAGAISVTAMLTASAPEPAPAKPSAAAPDDSIASTRIDAHLSPD